MRSVRGVLGLMMALCCGTAGAGELWSGKTVSVLGDSYSAYAGSPGCYSTTYPRAGVTRQSQMWWAQVIDAFGGELEVNRSYAGAALYTNYGMCHSLWHNMTNDGLGNPDVIMVMGGLNDFWVLQPYYRMGVGNFLTSVKHVFDRLVGDYPNAKKIIVIPKIHSWEPYRWGLASAYRTVLRDEACARGFRVVDLDGYLGTEDSDFDTPTYPHPTAQGHKKIADRIIHVLQYGGTNDCQRTYDCLNMDGTGCMITDYVTNGTTRIEVEAEGNGQDVWGMTGETNGVSSLVIGPCTNTIYAVRLWEGNALVRNYVPAQDIDGVATLYDAVSDDALAVSGGGTFLAYDYPGAYVNRAQHRGYDDLAEAYAAANGGECITMRDSPAQEVVVTGRVDVVIDTRGHGNVAIISPSVAYKVALEDGVLRLVENDDLQPQFVCAKAGDLFRPINGKLHIQLGNVLSGATYTLYTATLLEGPWTEVASGLEQSAFEIDAPPAGVKSFFIKAEMRLKE